MTIASFCPNCGSPRTGYELFCIKCGRALDVAAGEDVPATLGGDQPTVSATRATGQAAPIESVSAVDEPAEATVRAEPVSAAPEVREVNLDTAVAPTPRAKVAAAIVPAAVAPPAATAVGPPDEPSAPVAPAAGSTASPSITAAPAAVGPTSAAGGAALQSVRLPLAGLVAVVLGASAAATAIAIAVAIVLTGPGKADELTVSGELRAVEVANIRAEVPTNWEVVRQSSDTIAAADVAYRALWFRSDTVPTPVTLDELEGRFVAATKKTAQNVWTCGGPSRAPVPGGPEDGRYFMICSTFIPPGGGPASLFADAYYIGLDPTGTIVVTMQLTAKQENIEPFAKLVGDLPDPVWKLLD